MFGKSERQDAAFREGRKPAGLWHVVITRHSYRTSSLPWTRDALSPQRLKFRLEVFELACAPSVMAQTNQDFDWIIIIDKDHPASCRQRLFDYADQRPRTYIYESQFNDDISRNAWLTKYAATNCQYLITTNLDDDDSLPLNFIEALQSYVARLSGEYPPLMTLGYKTSLQWELISSRRAPFGYKCSWHRPNWVRSTGFSLACRPEHDLTVFAMPHVLGDLWFEDEKGDALRQILASKWGTPFPDEMQAHVEETGDELRGRADALINEAMVWRVQKGLQLFVDMSDNTGPLVMTNHFFVTLANRLLEHKSDRVPVTGRESFPNTMLKVELLPGRPEYFRKRWRMYRRMFSQVLSDLPYSKIRQSILVTWHFVRL